VTINLPVASIPVQEGMLIPQYDIVKAVPVYDLTLKQAKDSLHTVFLYYFRNIDVDITLIGMRQFMVFVAGEVVRPGIVPALPIDRVSVSVGLAGGVTTLGSRSGVQIFRQRELVAIANLDDFERNGNTASNPLVRDGDVIVVPRMERSVTIRGAVFGRRGYELRVAELTATRERTSEGLYELIEGERVSNLITKAGGITPWADALQTYVQRGDDKIKVDLNAVLTDPQHEDNIELADGDVLIVPSVNTLVYVQGQVVNPAAYPFQANLRATDYIGIAGGPLSDANMSGTHVQRGDEKLSIKKDPVIQEGDRIHVPRQVFKFWQDYVEIGAVVASLIISYLTLTAK
jgi:protein involved in polysaccharide export with SLBB domain